MFYIAHRAILDNNRDKENHPDQVKYCLNQGLDVEIDVWHIDNNFWLGHDGPLYQVKIEFLQQLGLWIHCKNINAVLHLRHYSFINYFTIDKDDFTFTSKNWLWLSPTYQNFYKDAICVMPEDPRWNFSKENLLDFAGVCSDNIYYYKDYVTNFRRRRGTN